jgi:hypothetical protein
MHYKRLNSRQNAKLNMAIRTADNLKQFEAEYKGNNVETRHDTSVQVSNQKSIRTSRCTGNRFQCRF